MEQAGQSALPVFAAGAAPCVREDIPGGRRSAVLIYHFTTVIYQNIFTVERCVCGKIKSLSVERCVYGMPAGDSGIRMPFCLRHD